VEERITVDKDGVIIRFKFANGYIEVYKQDVRLVLRGNKSLSVQDPAFYPLPNQTTIILEEE